LPGFTYSRWITSTFGGGIAGSEFPCADALPRPQTRRQSATEGRISSFIGVAPVFVKCVSELGMPSAREITSPPATVATIGEVTLSFQARGGAYPVVATRSNLYIGV
jgi:hypothetical protein